MAEKEVTSCCWWHKLLHRSFAMGLSVAVTKGNCQFEQYSILLFRYSRVFWKPCNMHYSLVALVSQSVSLLLFLLGFQQRGILCIGNSQL